MRPWSVEECAAYAKQLRDKSRANTAEHAAQAIEYLLGLVQAEQAQPVAWLPPDPPPECKSEAEKTAFAFGWFKALESRRTATTGDKP